MIEFIKTIGPILVGLAGLWVGYYFNKRTIKQKNVEEERKEIYKKLNSFYGPLLQLLGISFELSELLRFSRPKGFRTLIALLEGEKFVGNDKILLEQILDVEKAMDKLILEQSGLVEDEVLHALISKVGAHFRVLRLAYEGTLTGQIDRFGEHVFPGEITPRIEQEIKRLNDRLKQLNTV
jgi:hypothetical protein